MMEIRLNYSNDAVLREALYSLFKEVFGIDSYLLEDFYSKGYWNDTYQPFSYFHEGRAAANTSMFELPFIINGELVQTAGIQSVMTHQDYRGNGLMKDLFRMMLAEIDARYDHSFLMTEEPELYTRFGFRVIKEHTFALDFAHIPKQSELRRMNFFAEKDLFMALFKNRQPLSEVFFPLHYESSFALNMYQPAWHEKLYYSRKLNCMLVFEVKNQLLNLYDVIGPKLPSLSALCDEIPEPFQKIEFHFVPDAFEIQQVQAVKSDNTMVLMARPSLLSDNPYIKLPVTASF